MLPCYAAPMEGLTGAPFRRVHAKHFPGVAKYFSPFLSPTQDHLFTPRERRELSPESNAGVPLVPQLLTKNADDFLWAVGELAAMGYRQVDLNLGCPSGTVVAKGKGAGFLARPDELERFLDTVFSAELPAAISVKTRLGMDDPAEFDALLALYRRYPLAELTVHPRVRREQYDGTVHLDAYRRALDASPFPVCYNGDLVSPEDAGALARLAPGSAALMVGRGLIADPALPRRLAGGENVTREELRDFTSDLYDAYAAAFGSRRNAMMRMKELWSYLIFLFDERDALLKKLRRAADTREYESLAAAILQELPLRADAALPWRGASWAEEAPADLRTTSRHGVLRASSADHPI